MTTREQARRAALHRYGHLVTELEERPGDRLGTKHKPGDLAVIEGIADAVSDLWESALQDARDRTQFLVNFMNRSGWLEDGTFTFPDGETWKPDV